MQPEDKKIAQGGKSAQYTKARTFIWIPTIHIKTRISRRVGNPRAPERLKKKGNIRSFGIRATSLVHRGKTTKKQCFKQGGKYYCTTYSCPLTFTYDPQYRIPILNIHEFTVTHTDDYTRHTYLFWKITVALLTLFLKIQLYTLNLFQMIEWVGNAFKM